MLCGFSTALSRKYDLSEYEVDENDLSGVHGAEMLGIDPDSYVQNARMCGRKR